MPICHTVLFFNFYKKFKHLWEKLFIKAITSGGLDLTLLKQTY